MRPFLAIDWGTSNLRGWRIEEGGEIAAQIDLPLGVAKLAPGGAKDCFEQVIRPQLDPGGDLPALMCGMVGSNIGWQAAPYITCPANIGAVLRSLVRVEAKGPPMHIIPGLRTDGIARSSDVMRGEETQVFGWMALAPDRTKGAHAICHPGTHSKWILVKEGAITAFVSAMTGELFEVLSRHSILAEDGAHEDEDAFLEGVEAAGDGGALSARLFAVRARIVADHADPRTSHSYLSGLLVGAEIAALPRYVDAPRDADLHVVGSPRLRTAYVRALEASGWTCLECDGEEASVAGLKALADAGALNDA